MGKRIYRLSPQEVLVQKEALMGQVLSLVLLDSTVFFGKLKALDSDFFTCENMRGKKFTFPFVKVKEIIYDKHSSY